MLLFIIFSYLHRPAKENDNGLWENRVEWKARWVKEWQVKTLVFPIWRKVWGPVEIKEWIPISKTPSILHHDLKKH